MRKMYRFMCILPLFSLSLTIAGASPIRVNPENLQTSQSIYANNSPEYSAYAYSSVALNSRVDKTIKTQAESVLVPEPISLVLFGTGILVVYSAHHWRSKSD